MKLFDISGIYIYHYYHDNDSNDIGCEMRICARTDYACRALLELAVHWPSEAPVHAQDIAVKQRIPMKFLPHILISLKQLGYVQSIRGKKGGYVLSRPPREIRLREVLGNFEREPFGEKFAKKSDQENVFETVWQQADRAVIDVMDKVNFEDLRIKQRNWEEAPSYNI